MSADHIITPGQYTQPDVIQPATFTPLPPGGGQRHNNRRRTSLVLAGLAAAVIAWILWFLFTARSIAINVEPAEAGVKLEGGIHLKLADRYLLRSGDYQVSIQAPRYYPLQQDLRVGPEQNQRYHYQLQRLPGHLRVITIPATGVAVRVNHVLQGSAPLVVHNLSHGQHLLELAADRYLPYTQTVEIEGLDEEQQLTATLTPAWGNVAFASMPAGAEVYVDDSSVGLTPVTAEILQGNHTVRIQIAGYQSWSDSITVTANIPVTLPPVILKPADTTAYLETVPARANVTVNGAYVGETPVTAALPSGKNVEILFFKNGYQRARRTVTGASGANQRLLVNLEPELTAVRFQATPADAELYIDGILRGRAAQTLELTTQAHQIEIKKSGFVDYRDNITPRMGVAQEVNVSLKTVQQARQESNKPLISTAAGQQLKLLHPANFTMGSSRREPGRRANENLHNVVLNRAFYLSLKEVTNGEYRKFAANHNSGEVQGDTLNDALQPVVNITWDQAALYCNWLSKQEALPEFYRVENDKIIGANRNAIGYRLPTEAEWEWVARVVAKQQVIRFPWGDELPPPRNSGNYADESAAHLLGRIVSGYNDGYVVSAPVGSFAANSKGIFDLGGNVSEWVHDFYDSSIAAESEIAPNPLGPNQGDYHVIRGSSWRHGSITELRLSYRDYGNQVRDDAGFRLARYLDHE